MKTQPADCWMWARALQAIAQNGLDAAADPYDQERYAQVRALAAEMLASQLGAPKAQIEAAFAQEAGYATPKVDVRAAVFDAQHRLLLVRETDDNRWALPGGWADVDASPSENAVREVREETGYEVRATKLAAAWDRSREPDAYRLFSCYSLFFLCTLLGGEATTSEETIEVRWFAKADLPKDLSVTRVTFAQLLRMFDHHANPDSPCDFA